MDKTYSSPGDAEKARAKQAEEAAKAAGRNLDDMYAKAEFVKSTGKGVYDDSMSAAYNAWKAGPAGVKFLKSLGKATDSSGDEISEDKLYKNAKKMSDAKMSATAAYDNGTLTPTSAVKNKKTAVKNISTVAKAIDDAGKSESTVIPTAAKAEKMGEDASKTGHVITEEEAKSKIATVSKEIEESPKVQGAVSDAGFDLANSDTPPTEENVTMAEDNITADNGGVNPLDSKNSASQIVQDSNKLGTWDKIAIGLTAFSFLMAAVSGGAVLPMNFTTIGGTQDRIKALTKVRQDRDEFKTIMANAQDAQADKERFFNDNPNATEADYEKYQKNAGQYKYNVDEKSAQDTSDLDTWIKQNNITYEQTKNLKSIEHKYGLEDAQLANLLNLKLIDANGNWDIKKLNANADNQKAMAQLLEDLKAQGKSKEINAIANATGIDPEEVYTMGVTGKTEAGRVMDYIGSGVDTAGRAVDTVTDAAATIATGGLAGAVR